MRNFLNKSSALPGCITYAFSSHLIHTPWIIDSGASHHMTSSSNLFHTYSPCSGSNKIRIADASFSPIAGKGQINLTQSIDLESNCCVIFYDSYCEFQDRNSGKMIGSAKLIDGLYYFVDNSGNKHAQGLSIVSSISVYHQIMLWHLRLGHPSFAFIFHIYIVRVAAFL